MAWQLLDIKALKRRACFLIISLVIFSASLAGAVELNPIDLAMQTEKMGIVGVLVVVIVLQSVALLYLIRLIGTKFISLLERVIEAIEHCKQVKG